MNELEAAQWKWRISTYSKEGGDTCVEVGHAGDRVAVRDTTDRGRAAHIVATETWRVFIGGVRANRFSRR